MNPSEAIEALITAGWTEKSIGSEVDANQSTINRIRNGQVPNWETGAALVALAESIKARAV